MEEIKIKSGQIKPLIDALSKVSTLGETISCYLKIKIDDDTILIIDDGVGDALEIKNNNYRGTFGAPPTKKETVRNQCWDDIMIILRKNCVSLYEISAQLHKPQSILNKYSNHYKTPRPGTISLLVSKFINSVPDLKNIKSKYPQFFE